MSAILSAKDLTDSRQNIYPAPNMLSTQIAAVREILRNYKGVLEKIRKTRQAAIVTNPRTPQVAAESLDDLGVLQEARFRNSTKALLGLAGIIPKGSGLPADLSDNHSHYGWYKSPLTVIGNSKGS
jgi:hypothetical protein